MEMSGGGGWQQLCRLYAQTSDASGPAGHSTLDWPAQDREPVERPLSYELGNECQIVSFVDPDWKGLFTLFHNRMRVGRSLSGRSGISPRFFPVAGLSIR